MVLHMIDLALVQFQPGHKTDTVLLKKVGILLGICTVVEDYDRILVQQRRYLFEGVLEMCYI